MNPFLHPTMQAHVRGSSHLGAISGHCHVLAGARGIEVRAAYDAVPVGVSAIRFCVGTSLDQVSVLRWMTRATGEPLPDLCALTENRRCHATRAMPAILGSQPLLEAGRETGWQDEVDGLGVATADIRGDESSPGSYGSERVRIPVLTAPGTS